MLKGLILLLEHLCEVEFSCSFLGYFLALIRRARGEAMRYKLENHEFNSSWGHWDFSLTNPFRLQYVPGVDSTSTRNEYQGCLLATLSLGLTTLAPSCAKCLEILGASSSCSPKGLSKPVMGELYLYIYLNPTVISSHPRGKSHLNV